LVFVARAVVCQTVSSDIFWLSAHSPYSILDDRAGGMSDAPLCMCVFCDLSHWCWLFHIPVGSTRSTGFHVHDGHRFTCLAQVSRW
jgi:hypothetical protein